MKNASNAKSEKPQTQAPLPFLFSGIEVLDSAKHGALKLNRADGFRFAAEINSVPLCLDEIPIAAEHYPIVFAQAGQAPLAVLGCRDRENLFVDAAGRWLTGAYVPAYLRAWPFIAAAPDEESENVVIAIEPHSPHLQLTEGTPLFESGKPSRLLNEVIALTSFYRANVRATRRFVEAIDNSGLLHTRGATLKFRSGENLQLAGFKVIDPAQFDQLPDQQFLDWRKANWLAPLYAILRSSARWSHLIDVAEARRGIRADSVIAGLHPGEHAAAPPTVN